MTDQNTEFQNTEFQKYVATQIASQIAINENVLELIKSMSARISSLEDVIKKLYEQYRK